jgi:hypothetical protein
MIIARRVLAFLTLAGTTTAFYLIATEFASAATFYPLAPAPGGTRLGDLYGSNSLGQFFNRVFIAAIAVGAILAVLRLAFAGYLYMTTEAWGQKSRAKEIIGDVILGLLLLLSIWLILRQINPNLLNLDFTRNVRQVQPGPPSGAPSIAPSQTNPASGLTPAQESQTTGGAMMP